MQKQSGLALWRQIYQQIEADIASGAAEPGMRLPTEAELALRFGVNRHTVRRAMSELQGAGLLRIERGNGTFVADGVIDYPVSRRTRYSDILLASGHEPTAQLLQHEIELATRSVAEGLAIAEDSPVLFMVSLGSADGRPLALTERRLPLPRFEGFAERYARLGSISRVLAEYGVADYTRAHTRVWASLPEDTVAAKLQQPRSQPVLITESVNIDADGVPIEYTISRHAGARVRLSLDAD